MFQKLSESTGELFPNRMRAIDAHRIIRSCSKPFPGAFVVDQKLGKVRIWKAKLTKNSDNNAYSVTINDGLLNVAFVDGYIYLMNTKLKVNPRVVVFIPFYEIGFVSGVPE